MPLRVFSWNRFTAASIVKKKWSLPRMAYRPERFITSRTGALTPAM